jgi:DNA repair ATPase RecN
MEYKKLVAVTGLSGLFEMISSKSDGGIIRSLEDNTTKFASNRLHSFSHLESIEVYTTDENVNLVDVFHAMEKSSEKLPDAQDGKAVKTYLQKVYPTMDFERVYASDMKKMIKWFEQLKKHQIEIKLSEESGDLSADDKPVEKQPAKVAAAPKATAVKSGAVKKVNAPRKMA